MAKRLETVGVWVAIGVMVGVAWIDFRTTEGLVETSRWVVHTQEVIQSFDDVLLATTAAGRARRSYWMTGDEAEADRAVAAIAHANGALDQVRMLTVDNPEQQERWQRLKPLVETRLHELRTALENQRASGERDGAREEAFLRRGNAEMTAVAAAIDSADAAERTLLAERQASATRSARFAKSTGLAGTAIAIAIIAFAFARLRRENDRRIASERALRGSAEALHSAAAAAQNANRELEAFSYSVAHDLRAPLRAIDGFSQALLEDCADRLDDTGRSHLARVRASATRMADLIDGLLGLSRLARADMQLESVDLSALAAQVIEELRLQNPDRDVAVEIAPGLTVRGDARILRVVVDNLLRNAFKFTAKRPHASIAFGATYTTSASSTAGARTFFVKDDGVGFDPRYKDKLFGAFQRLHDAREFPGTGIGLATVERAVKRHGGRVWAEGEPGRGATFFFTLSESDTQEHAAE